MDRAAFEQGLRENGYDDVVEREVEAEKVNATHVHEFDARLFILDGELTLVRNGAPHTYRAGESCEVPAGTVHEERFGPKGCCYIAGRRHAAARA